MGSLKTNRARISLAEFVYVFQLNYINKATYYFFFSLFTVLSFLYCKIYKKKTFQILGKIVKYLWAQIWFYVSHMLAKEHEWERLTRAFIKETEAFEIRRVLLMPAIFNTDENT